MKGFDILSSGMSAQRARLHTVSSNLANAHTTRTEDGGPYQRRDPVFETMLMGEDPDALGVRVAEVREDQSLGPLIHDPSHPDADADGNVRLPNVNVVEEMVDMMTASRSFEANTQAFQTLRDMVRDAIALGR
ncbi:MAG: flagellar basal body rod protein FlgC [Phycisphaeraceae bacterium]|nr:flagellar basal body rod protein FlgC [Phycisphaeraceae bacterium]